MFARQEVFSLALCCKCERKEQDISMINIASRPLLKILSFCCHVVTDLSNILKDKRLYA